VAAGEPRAAITAGIGYVPADRAHALLPRSDVRENLTLADLTPFRRGIRLRRDLELRETRRWVAELGIRPADPDKPVAELSGGNQQKVVLARWLRTAPAVLVLDEPTQGVDVGAKADIHRLVAEAAAAGTAVVVCSTDSAELAQLASAVIVLRRGRASIRLTGAAVTGERIEQELLAADEPAA
jgi:ribose transport system ATP-binding protein